MSRPFSSDGNTFNVTVQYFPPLWATSSSIAFSALFLVSFVVFFVFFFVFLLKMRNRKEFKRNHKILLTLVAIIVSIQFMCMVVSIIYNSLSMTARTKLENNGRVTWGFFVGMHVALVFKYLFRFSNMVLLFVIIYVVQMIFWKTAHLTRTISAKTFGYIKILMNIVNVAFIIIATFFVFGIVASHMLFLFGYLSGISVTGILIGCFVCITAMLIFDSIMALISGILVMRTIRRTTKKVERSNNNNNNTTLPDESVVQKEQVNVQVVEKEGTKSNNHSKFQKRVQNPIKMTVGLLFSLIMCVVLEVAAGAGGSTSSVNLVLGLIWHVLNSLGVLGFAVAILSLFYPAIMRTDDAIKELKKVAITQQQPKQVDETCK